MKSKKKSLFLIVTLLLVAVVACCLPFMKLKHGQPVLADEVNSVYQFIGSNTTNVATSYNSSNYQRWGIINIKFTLTRISNGVNVVSSGVGQYNTSGNTFSSLYSFSFNVNKTTSGWQNQTVYLSGTSGWFNVGINTDDISFNCNVLYVEYFTIFENPGTSMTTCIKYFDSNGHWLQFSFSCYGSSYYNEFSKLALTSRTYYFNNNFNDNEYYTIGYSDGSNDGYTSGYSDGSSVASVAQYNAGYTAGHAAGVNDANTYSFGNLMSAVIDAPITAITGLLNFEILGVNLSAFVYGLFSITVVIVVLKYIKGGK